MANPNIVYGVNVYTRTDLGYEYVQQIHANIWTLAQTISKYIVGKYLKIQLSILSELWQEVRRRNQIVTTRRIIIFFGKN